MLGGLRGGWRGGKGVGFGEMGKRGLGLMKCGKGKKGEEKEAESWLWGSGGCGRWCGGGGGGPRGIWGLLLWIGGVVSRCVLFSDLVFWGVGLSGEMGEGGGGGDVRSGSYCSMWMLQSASPTAM